MVSAVREGDPSRLHKRLTGDLDSIVLTALQKEPGAGTAQWNRWRMTWSAIGTPAGKAREATPWYRAKRFVRRNPGGVLAAVLALTSVLGGGVAVVWHARHDIEAATRVPGHQVFLAPVWLFFYAIAIILLSGAVYFSRPSMAKLFGAAAGGFVWAISIVGKSWLEYAQGWWRSNLVETADPLLLFVPYTWFIFVIAGMALLLLASIIGRRFGWKGQVVFLGIFAFFQATRERIWFSKIIPALTYEPGLLPIVSGTAMLFAGGVIGLCVMRLIAGADRPEKHSDPT
ncbi:MAG: hypothetical protein WKF37_21315 [Bryobacteraceae bacterium]